MTDHRIREIAEKHLFAIPDSSVDNTRHAIEFAIKEALAEQEKEMPSEEGSPMIGFLHRHPKMEAEKGIDSEHVIVDRKDWLRSRIESKKESGR